MNKRIPFVNGPLDGGYLATARIPMKRYEFPIEIFRRGIYELQRSGSTGLKYVYAGEANQLRRAIAEIAEWANAR